MKLPARATRLTPLQLAIGISLAAHALLLGWRFGAPENFHRVFEDSPLEVILVNAQADDAPPDRAQAIAQANLAGGGDADRGRATSPLPYSALTSVGESFEDQQRQVDALQEQQQHLMAQVRAEIARLPVPDPKRAADSAPERQAQEERRRQLVRLLAEIERRVNEENARPRKRYISPATREAAYAVYYDHLRQRVEQRGTAQFPEAGGHKLYGQLTMMITVNHDGSVLATQIMQGSGNPALDRRAEAIARSAGPFGPFDDSMRARADQIVVVSRFRFTREATLETDVQ